MKNRAKQRTVPCNIVRPNGMLQVYKKSGNSYKTYTINSNVQFKMPSSDKLRSLKINYYKRWNAHLALIKARKNNGLKGCEFNCEKLEWPCKDLSNIKKYYR